MSDHPRPIALKAQDAPPKAKKSNYPEPFASLMQAREKRPLGDLFGLTSFGVNLTRLAPGGMSALRHAHIRQDEWIYVLEGEGYSIIEGARVEWREGDALYVPPWAWHQHVAAATGPARYLTGTNLPLLQSLGQTVLREEER